MRGKTWLFEDKMLGCAVVTVALIPRTKFENRRKKEKNKSTFVYVNTTGDVTFFYFQNIIYRRLCPLFKYKKLG